ncbi:MAG: hypothetical protein ABI172_03440 [Ginsengibacter sp.]
MKYEPTAINFNDNANNNGMVNSWINAETVYNYQKEFIDMIVKAKDAEIATLKQVIEA